MSAPSVEVSKHSSDLTSDVTATKEKLKTTIYFNIRINNICMYNVVLDKEVLFSWKVQFLFPVE